MNKQEMVDAVARHLGVTKGKATEITDLFFGADGLIAAELREGRKVNIAGFGSFEPRSRAAREGRHPQNGRQIAIKASTVTAFRAGKALKDLVNGG